MTTQESPEIFSSQGYTDCVATHGTIPSERNQELSWENPTNSKNENITRSKQVGKTESWRNRKSE